MKDVINMPMPTGYIPTAAGGRCGRIVLVAYQPKQFGRYDSILRMRPKMCSQPIYLVERAVGEDYIGKPEFFICRPMPDGTWCKEGLGAWTRKCLPPSLKRRISQTVRETLRISGKG